MKKLNKIDFIEKANKIHNFKYDYSEVDYINSSTKIKIFCKTCNKYFYQIPNSHLNGHGCKLCYNIKSHLMQKSTKDEFIEKSIITHKNEYDYSEVDYVNSSTKVKILCKKCEKFFYQRPASHSTGRGCPYCFGTLKSNKEEFIKRSIVLHGDKYDYSEVDYVNSNTKVKIFCKNCKKYFYQTPHKHYNSKFCPICSCYHQYDVNEFIEKANKIHNFKYDYSEVNYLNSKTKVKIICLKHGEFYQIPNSHLVGRGCPNCKESKGENEISKILDELNIQYIRQKRFKDCKYKRTLPFDFYLQEKNICIEFDGYFHFNNRFNTLEYVQRNDNIKTEYCLKNNIQLLRLTINDFKNFRKILSSI